MNGWKRLLVTVLGGVVLLGCCCNFGCNSIPAAMPGEFATAARQLSTSMVDQAVWSELQGNLRGHALQPGYRTAAGVEYFAEVKIIGFDGDVGISADGTGTGQLTQQARDAIIDLAREDMSLRARAIDFLTELGRNLLTRECETQPSP